MPGKRIFNRCPKAALYDDDKNNFETVIPMNGVGDNSYFLHTLNVKISHN
jgi:hypothetical protein